MNNTQHTHLIEDFFKVFADSIAKILAESLDTDICTNIKFDIVSVGKIRDAEDLKSDNAIYKMDFATGSRQGSMSLLIPEDLIASISDVLTGGSGKDAYKGVLSEIETNSTSKILEKLFKEIEAEFKKYYEHDLVFSANSKLSLKEHDDYQVNTESTAFDFLLSAVLSLTNDKKYSINLVLSSNVLDNLLNDIGLNEEGSVKDKKKHSKITVDSLSDITINITAELGRTRVPIKYALELVRGSLVELETMNNADIKVFANGVEFAYAQIVAIGDYFGLKITKVISPEERLKNI